MKRTPFLEPAAERLPGLSRWRGLDTAGRCSDVLAGLITAALLVPQGMAYAALAGLPAEMGLYSALLPLLVYAMFGTSRVIAMGPMALTALLVGETLRGQGIDSSQFPAWAGTLALLVGAWLLLLYALRLGRLIDFVSPAVMQGFTAASALMIVISQLAGLFDLAGGEGNFFRQAAALLAQWASLSLTPVLFGTAALVMLVMIKHWLAPLLRMLGLPASVASIAGRCGPLLLLIAALVLVAWMDLPLARVGTLPAGLPGLTLPALDLDALGALAAPALGIALINYVSAISVAQTLAARQRERLYTQRELWVLGLCNLCAALSRGFPVTSGLGRAVVNLEAGSRTPLSSLFAAIALAAVLLFAAGIFAPLPKAVLAAVVIQAAWPLLDLRPLRRTWRYSRADGAAWLGAFAGVLVFGVMEGLAIGVGIALALLLTRASRPYIDEVGRLPQGGFRNPARYPVEIPPHLLMVRPGADLNFANMGALERFINAHLADRDGVTDLVLVMSGVLYIDGAALEALAQLDQRLEGQGVTLWFAELRAPVRDQLSATPFLASHRERVFFSTEDAWRRLAMREEDFSI